VQLATKGGEIIETTSKGDDDRGRFGHCFELWCLRSKERDGYDKRGDNRLLEIKPSATGLKNLRKALLPLGSLPKQTGATCCERRRDRLKFLKMIVVMAVLVTALGLGACAQHKEVVVPPTPKGGK
jgi:hypothetical protein